MVFLIHLGSIRLVFFFEFFGRVLLGPVVAAQRYLIFVVQLVARPDAARPALCLLRGACDAPHRLASP
jgi:hypothetical protein